MRVNQGYWIWGLFSSRDYSYLNNIKNLVRTHLNSPKFDLHLTVSGPYESLDQIFFRKIKTLAENSNSIMLEIKAYEHKQEIFESFYLSIKNKEDLNFLRNNIFKIKKFDLQKKYFPHISLVYGNHSFKEKSSLILKLPDLKKSIKMTKLAIVRVDESINLWKILKIYNFKNLPIKI